MSYKYKMLYFKIQQSLAQWFTAGVPGIPYSTIRLTKIPSQTWTDLKLRVLQLQF